MSSLILITNIALFIANVLLFSYLIKNTVKMTNDEKVKIGAQLKKFMKKNNDAVITSPLKIENAKNLLKGIENETPYS